MNGETVLMQAAQQNETQRLAERCGNGCVLNARRCCPGPARMVPQAERCRVQAEQSRSLAAVKGAGKRSTRAGEYGLEATRRILTGFRSGNSKRRRAEQGGVVIQRSQHARKAISGSGWKWLIGQSSIRPAGTPDSGKAA